MRRQSYPKLIAAVLFLGSASRLPAPPLQQSLLDNEPTPVTIPESMRLNLERDDFLSIVSAVRDEFKANPIVGSIAEKIEGSFSVVSIAAEGVDYQFSISEFNIEPGEGRLRVSATIKNLNITIKKLLLNRSGSNYCTNLSVHSGQDVIHSYAELVPRAEEGHFTLTTENARMKLTADNFQVRPPSSCNILPGMNELALRTLPWLINATRSKISDALAAKLAEKAKALSQSFDRTLSGSISVPFALPPLPSFRARLGVFPQTITIEPERVVIVIGTHVALIPSIDDFEEEFVGTTELDYNGEFASWFGVSEAFFTAFVNEAKRQGLLDFELSADTMPELENILLAGKLYSFIPDAEVRYPAEAPLSLYVTGAEVLKIVHSTDDDAEVDLKFDRLHVALAVRGEDYQNLELSGALRLRLGINQGANKIELRPVGLKSVTVQGTFAPGIVPIAPTLGGFNETAFLKTLGSEGGGAIGLGNKFLSLNIPSVRLGENVLNLSSANAQEGYIAIGGKIERRN